MVPYIFSDRNVSKNRPALILSSDAYHASRQEVIVAAITSRIRDPLFVGDHLIVNWQASGLVRPSVVTGILRTVKNYIIVRKMGVMAAQDMDAVEAAIKQALAL